MELSKGKHIELVWEKTIKYKMGRNWPSRSPAETDLGVEVDHKLNKLVLLYLQKTQYLPGLHEQKCCMQATGSNSPSLVPSGEDSPGGWHPGLSSTLQTKLWTDWKGPRREHQK